MATQWTDTVGYVRAIRYYAGKERGSVLQLNLKKGENLPNSTYLMADNHVESTTLGRLLDRFVEGEINDIEVERVERLHFG